jgi:hypothetical protein
MADLLIRMFDQNTFAEGLLRPEYDRIKEIDQAIAELEVERAKVNAHAGAQAETSAPQEAPAEEAPAAPAAASTIDEDELPADTTTL